MRSRSRACKAALARSRRYLRSTRSMNAERECFDPARRSTLLKTSFDSVIEVFSFILPSYYHWTESCKAKSAAEGTKSDRDFLLTRGRYRWRRLRPVPGDRLALQESD